MNYAQIRKYDVANGIGVRTTIFVSGCTHNCPSCFNKEYQNFKYGNKFTQETEQQILENLSDPNVKGLSVLGGEPMQNAKGLILLLRRVREEFPDKNIWIWSGYTYEEIKQNQSMTELLSLCDVLVDGRFVQELKSAKLKFRGSSNQRVIDVQKTLKTGQIVLYLE